MIWEATIIIMVAASTVVLEVPLLEVNTVESEFGKQLFMDILKSIWLIHRHSNLHKIVTTRLNIGGTNLHQCLNIKHKTRVQSLSLLDWDCRNIK
jgi:hypothetical protein